MIYILDNNFSICYRSSALSDEGGTRVLKKPGPSRESSTSSREPSPKGKRKWKPQLPQKIILEVFNPDPDGSSRPQAPSSSNRYSIRRQSTTEEILIARGFRRESTTEDIMRCRNFRRQSTQVDYRCILKELVLC